MENVNYTIFGLIQHRQIIFLSAGLKHHDRSDLENCWQWVHHFLKNILLDCSYQQPNLVGLVQYDARSRVSFKLSLQCIHCTALLAADGPQLQLTSSTIECAHWTALLTADGQQLQASKSGQFKVGNFVLQYVQQTEKSNSVTVKVLWNYCFHMKTNYCASVFYCINFWTKLETSCCSCKSSTDLKTTCSRFVIASTSLMNLIYTEATEC